MTSQMACPRCEMNREVQAFEREETVTTWSASSSGPLDQREVLDCTTRLGIPGVILPWVM